MNELKVSAINGRTLFLFVMVKISYCTSAACISISKVKVHKFLEDKIETVLEIRAVRLDANPLIDFSYPQNSTTVIYMYLWYNKK